MGGNKLRQALRFDARVLPEFKIYDIALAFDGVYSYAHAPELERGIVQQVADRWRRRSVTIFKFCGDIAQLTIRFHAGDALVHPQALIFFGNVLGGNTNVESEVELRLGFVGRDFAFHFADGALQHLGIQFEADGFDMTALLAAQQVAGAAEFEVERGNLESGSEIGEFFERGQAAARNRSELNLRGKQEVRVGSAVGSSDPPAELVQLG